jgi:hypothetical protein
MRNLLLLIALGVLGYYAYREWFSESVRPPVVVPSAPPRPVVATPPGADRVSSRVRKMYDEWKNRALATEKVQQGARKTDMSVVLTEIRRILGEDFGLHTPSAVREVIVHCLPVPESEKDYVYKSIINAANKDAQIGGHNRAD